MTRTAVYRFFASDGWLLYVGMTVDPTMRFAFHEQNAPWWRQADPDRTTITWFDSRPEAAVAETNAIRDENPEWNIAGRRGYRIPGPAGRPRTVLDAEQETALAEAVEATQAARDAEQISWLAVQTAREAGVPDTVLCNRAEISRATVNRKLGSRSAI